MPGYGIAGAAEGGGLLPWSWAERRLAASYRYWVASVGPAGRPHAMPVWGVWLDDVLWFSTGGRSRKARNLGADPRCVVSTEDAAEPVVIEGTAQALREVAAVGEVVTAYETKYAERPPDVAENPIFGVRPRRAFGLIESADDFAGSATRWVFER
jgi:hypothetical protein